MEAFLFDKVLRSAGTVIPGSLIIKMAPNRSNIHLKGVFSLQFNSCKV
jgi:hypothetical protein